MKIAVTTPDRPRRIARRAGVRPRVLLRDPDRLDAEIAEHVDPAVGGLRDADYVAEATEGDDAIYWVHPRLVGWAAPTGGLPCSRRCRKP
jgi:uncharacterized protein YbjT (DUF2867 family)